MKKFLQKGTKFGRLTVIEYVYKEHKTFEDSKKNYYIYYYKCKCDCGNIGVYNERSLKSGNTKSCGCYNHDAIVERNKKHNLSKTRLYKIYYGIKKRCYNKNCKSYKDYGAKNIKFCNEWKDNFLAFYHWAINNGYNDNLTIERINFNQDYCPDNCKWIPKNEQSKNTSANVYYEYNGEKHILNDWAKIYNLPFTCIRKRLCRGWSLEKALNTPKLR